MESERRKKGDIHPETGKVFWSYTRAVNGGEYWVTPEDFIRKQELRKTYKLQTQRYWRKWYKENKDKPKYKQKGIDQDKKLRKEAPIKLLYSNVKSMSKKRGRCFELSLPFIYEQLEKQEWKCYYTGVRMINSRENRDPRAVSIDRIDSTKGYTEDNVALCCQSINFAKNCYNVEDFKKFIQEIRDANNRP